MKKLFAMVLAALFAVSAASIVVAQDKGAKKEEMKKEETKKDAMKKDETKKDAMKK